MAQPRIMDRSYAHASGARPGTWVAWRDLYAGQLQHPDRPGAFTYAGNYDTPEDAWAAVGKAPPDDTQETAT
jgi:hypothetical protein